MPKITEHGGPSNFDANDGAEVVVQEPIPVAAEEPAEVETDDTQDSYEDWTVVQLSEELGRRKQPRTGTKTELIARLEANDEEEADKKEEAE